MTHFSSEFTLGEPTRVERGRALVNVHDLDWKVALPRIFDVQHPNLSHDYWQLDTRNPYETRGFYGTFKKFEWVAEVDYPVVGIAFNCLKKVGEHQKASAVLLVRCPQGPRKRVLVDHLISRVKGCEFLLIDLERDPRDLDNPWADVIEIWHIDRLVQALRISLKPSSLSLVELDSILLGSVWKYIGLARDPAVQRSIEFPPEMKDAGVAVLNHFAKYLKLQYPDVEASVRITQNNNQVTMEIETPEGDVERVEHSLEGFGLVAAGHLAPSDWLSNPLDVMRLEMDLERVQMQLSQEQRFAKLEAKQARKTERLKNSEIKVLKGQVAATEEQNRVMGQLLAASLGQRDTLPQLIENLVDRIAKGLPNPAAEVVAFETVVAARPEWDEQVLTRELQAAREQDPDRFGEFSRNVAASGMASGLVQIVKVLAGVL